MPSDHISLPAAVGLPDAAKRTSPWQVFMMACGGTFLVSLDSTIVIAAYPDLLRSFPAATLASLSWVLNAYTIVYAALLIPFGRLSDRVGATRVFFWGVALFGLASLLCAMSSDTTPLIAARVLKAAGGAMLTPASLMLILAAFPPSKRAAVVGLWSAVGALAAALGPGLGGAMVGAFGWPSTFLINLPVATALTVLASGLPRRAGQQIAIGMDLPGTVLVCVAFAALTWGIIATETGDWTDRVVYLPLVLGTGSAIAYVFWARGRANATIDLALFRDRAFSFATLAATVFGAGFSMLFLGYFLFLARIWDFSEAATGLAVMPGPLIVIPVAILGGHLAGRTGHRPLLLLGAAGFVVAQIVLLATATPDAKFWTYWLPLQVLGGISVGLLLPALSGAAVAHLPANRFGVGGAVHTALRQFGGVIGTAATVVLVGAPDAGLAAFQTLFLCLAVLGTVTGLLCLPVNTRPQP